MQREERDSDHPLFVCTDSGSHERVRSSFWPTRWPLVDQANLSSEEVRRLSACTKRIEAWMWPRMQPGTRRERFYSPIIVLLLFLCLIDCTAATWKRREDKTKCPKVKGIRNFDISEVRFVSPLIIACLTKILSALWMLCSNLNFRYFDLFSIVEDICWIHLRFMLYER